jgi:hypothetical protein
MKKVFYLPLVLVLFFSSCIEDIINDLLNDDTFVSYHFDYVSMVNGNKFLEESSFISGDSLMFRLNSYQILKDYYKLEPIDINSISLTCDGDIMIAKDTIHENENILLKIPDKQMISFEKQGNSNPLYYDLIIHSIGSYKLKLNNIYYRFKIKAKTVNGFDASDSILTKYNNR